MSGSLLVGMRTRTLTQDGTVSRSAQAPHIGTPTCAGRGFRSDVGCVKNHKYVPLLARPQTPAVGEHRITRIDQYDRRGRKHFNSFRPI